jgi:NAD(P)H-dependent flavin oxidoreductase YrpB (nitropropane dioxygenase family)
MRDVGEAAAGGDVDDPEPGEGGVAEVAVGLIEAIRAGTDRPFNVNFITSLTETAQVDVACNEGVPVVSFHWGHPPRSWIDALHSSGVKVWEQVGSPDAAKRAVDDGIDLVVAQGTEAGGHNLGTLPTVALLPLVADAVAPALVLGAGGIADGRGLAAALTLGADGVWIGTRLVATAESGAHPEYQARLVAARGADTITTHVCGRNMPEFNPMRVLRNRVVSEWHGRVYQLPTDAGTQPVIGQAGLIGTTVDLHRFTNFVPIRSTTGDLEEMPLLAGQGVGLVDSVPAVADVIDAMMTDAMKTIRAVGRRVG